MTFHCPTWQLPFTFSTSAVGFVLRPEKMQAGLWCGYPHDGGSMRQPDHGCGADSYPPEQLEAMLVAHEASHPRSSRCVINDPRAPADADDRSGCQYNEVIAFGLLMVAFA